MKATVYQRNEILLGIGDLFESCDTEFHIAFMSKWAQDLKKRKIIVAPISCSWFASYNILLYNQWISYKLIAKSSDKQSELPWY